MSKADPIDGVAPVRSRRGFLAAVAGVLAGALGTSIERATPASAANGDAVKAGQTTTATALTRVENTSDTGAGLWGVANGFTRHGIFGTNTGNGHGAGGVAHGAFAAGVHGTNDNAEGYGVWGEASGSEFGIGVYGTANVFDGAGVQGQADGDGGQGVVGTSSGARGVGVSGFVNGGGSVGVDGSADASDGVGVRGRGFVAGAIGVFADDQGYAGVTALKVAGTAVFSRSGIAMIAKGARKATVTGVSLTAASLVLATVQAQAKQYVRSAVPDVAGSRFTIELNAAATSHLPVAWFIVN